MLNAKAIQAARRRWDEQQSHYTPWRDERWRVVLDLLSNLSPGVVVDVGCGPGTLTTRLALGLGAHPDSDSGSVSPESPSHTARETRWQVVGLEADGFLLALAATDPAPVTWVRGERLADLPSALGRCRAVVSSAVLHYLEPERLVEFYRDALTLVGPDGVVVTIEELDDPSASDPARDEPPAPAASPVSCPASSTSPWTAWWQAVEADPTLRRLRAGHPVPVWSSPAEPLSLAEHLACARLAGGCPSILWRRAASTVLATRAIASGAVR